MKKLKHFDNHYFAVFNAHPTDFRKGRAAVLKKYGEFTWATLKRNMRTGVMEIFQHKANPVAKLYVRAVAKSADALWERRNKK